MTLDEDIETLNHLPVLVRTQEDYGRCRAILLGIEALKRIRSGRLRGYDYFDHPLPGETRD